jgi:Family of unknown function (DUF5995)
MPNQFSSIDDVVTGLTRLEERFQKDGDRRAIFATAYLTMTTELVTKLTDGFFLDKDWVSRYAVSFAILYFQALEDYGSAKTVPKAWKRSFDTAVRNEGLAIQDLLLGINAHVNHDLPYALAGISTAPRDRRYVDHCLINQVLKDATDRVQQRIGEVYAPGLQLIEELAGSLDEGLANFSLEKARENAWISAVALENAKDANELRQVQTHIENHSAVLANLVLFSTAKFPFLVPLLRLLEEKRLRLAKLRPN